MQIRSDRAGAIEDDLARSVSTRSERSSPTSALEPVLEMLVRLEGEPRSIARALRGESAGDRRDSASRRVHVHPVGSPATRRRCSPASFAEAADDRAGRGPDPRRRAQRAGAPTARRARDVAALLEAVPGLRLRLGPEPHGARARAAAARARASASASCTSPTRRCPTRTTTCRSAAAASTSRRSRTSTVPLDPRDRRPAALAAATASTRTRRCVDVARATPEPVAS